MLFAVCCFQKQIKIRMTLDLEYFLIKMDAFLEWKIKHPALKIKKSGRQGQPYLVAADEPNVKMGLGFVLQMVGHQERI